jgi:hypothetical protein
MYATIDEAWGVTSSTTSQLPKNTYEIPDVQKQVLASSSITTDDLTQQQIRRYISEEYRKNGMGGILPLLDSTIVRDLRAPGQTGNQTGWLAGDTDLFVLILAFALLLVLDSSS